MKAILTLASLATCALSLFAAEANAQYLSIQSATYGANCGAYSGNVSYDVQNNCSGRTSCRYTIDANRIGDPAPGCTKSFQIVYQCSGDYQSRVENVSPEANGKSLLLSCSSNANYGIAVTSATYGGNVGVFQGNVTGVARANCDGRSDCDIYVSGQTLGDPAPGQVKSFEIYWKCPSGQNRSQYIAANSEGQFAHLSCR